jgi:hypothetical protein
MKIFFQKIIIFILKKLRKIFKSLGKYEDKFIKKIIVEENKIYNQNKIINNYKYSEILKNLNNNKFFPKKIAIVICFYFNKKSINDLIITCKNIKNFENKINITIITNNIDKKNKILLSKKIKSVLKKFKIIIIKNIPEPNLLPWFSINIMKKKFHASYSHFLYLEHDIIFKKENLIYWNICRKILKSKNLIPSFIRTEKNKKNEKFAVDAVCKIDLINNPKIYFRNKYEGFVNNKNPYQGAYLMDRDLMREYLNSPASTVDFGFFNKELRNKYPIKELLNISIAYHNIPKGYYNRYMIPFDNKKEIPDYCLIEHSSNKYVNLKNEIFSKINLNELLN